MTWKVNNSAIREKGDVDDLIFAANGKSNNQPVQIHSER